MGHLGSSSLDSRGKSFLRLVYLSVRFVTFIRLLNNSLTVLEVPYITLLIQSSFHDVVTFSILALSKNLPKQIPLRHCPTLLKKLDAVTSLRLSFQDKKGCCLTFLKELDTVPLVQSV
jgi:hypothetical protein